MASDLSTLIKDGLCSTIQGLLAKDVSVNNIFKVEEENFEDIQLLSIDSTFEFENITSSWNFIFPALASSVIFNAMMGMEEEPSTSIDADMADAIKEVVSNISGGLTTAINGAGYKDLSGAKFSIQEDNIIQSTDMENFDNIFRFSINIDQTTVEIFIQFDNVILPFINDIKNSPLAEKPVIEITPEVENTPEPEPEPEPEPIIEEVKEPEPVVEEPKKEEKKEELTDDDKKNKKIKMIIMGVGGTLGLVIISAIVFYFLGWFDPPPPPPVKIEQNTTKKLDDNGIEVIEYPKRKKSTFKIEMIDVKHLNRKLALLIDERYQQTTKTIDSKIPIIPVTIAKQQTNTKIVQKTNIKKELPQKIETAAANQKQPIAKQQQVQDINKFNILSTYVLRYRTYGKLLKTNGILNTHVSLCRDANNRSIIYIGPFMDATQENLIFKKIKTKYTKDIKRLVLDKEIFNKRCN